MKLDKNVIRINGYKDNKRTHVDIITRMGFVEFTSGGIHHKIEAPFTAFDITERGFKEGLEAVTSYNYFNWCANERMTVKLD